MRDIIDLGNLVFDQLIKSHGEIPDSRMIFLYGVTTGTTWFIFNTNKIVTITSAGVETNFEDQVIIAVNDKWQEVLNQRKINWAIAQKAKLYKDEVDLTSDGMIEWGTGETQFREINFTGL